MLAKGTILFILLVTLASLPGCVVHPGYYADDSVYYYEPYYPYYYSRTYPYYYSRPYFYVPFGFEFRGDFGRGGHRGFGGHHGGGRHWR